MKQLLNELNSFDMEDFSDSRSSEVLDVEIDNHVITAPRFA